MIATPPKTNAYIRRPAPCGNCASKIAIASARRRTGRDPGDRVAAVFEPLVQVRSDLTRTEEGAGLGLAISRQRARGMGGNLVAESTLEWEASLRSSSPPDCGLFFTHVRLHGGPAPVRR